jgi:ferredoxin
VQVRIDENICQGHTLCSYAAPDIFLLREEDGHAYVLDPNVAADREAAVRAAALTCPELAIIIVE